MSSSPASDRSAISEEKRRLREWARAQPRCSPAEGSAVVDAVASWLRTQNPSRVAAYMAFAGEIPIERVIDRLADRHQFLLTRTPRSGPLSLHAHGDRLERHAFGFLQPLVDAPEIDPATVDIVLAPGLCFDRRGGRIGWGRGYYDELLSRTSGVQAVVGITLERFVVDRIPVEPHDRSMTHLATERGITILPR